MSEEKKTVRVRVAVCVTANGDWNAVGWCGAGDVAMEAAQDPMDASRGEELYWLEAELALPEPRREAQTVEGEVHHAD